MPMNRLRNIGILVSILVFIFVSVDAEGQKYRKRYGKRGPSVDVRLGLRAGANYSTFTGDEFTFQLDDNGEQVVPFPERSFDYSIGYHGGMYMDILFKRGFHLQPEINYTRLGSKFSTPIEVLNAPDPPIMTSYETEILNDYIQFNLLTKIGLGKNDKFRFLIGPGVAFKNSELVVYTYPTEVSEENRFVAPTISVFEGTDIQAHFGFEYQMDMGVSIGLRFMQGFMNVYDQPVNSIFEPVDLQPLQFAPENFNRSGYFSVAYTFNHYKRLFLTRKGRRFSFKKRRF